MSSIFSVILILYLNKEMCMHKNSPTREDLKLLSHTYQVKFAVFCARQALHLVNKKDLSICENAINMAERWLIGEATVEECKAAADAAAYDAAYAAAAAAYAASAAAYAAAAAAADAADAADAAAYAAAAAAYAAADAAAAAYAAAYAADANKQQVVNEQWEVYNDLLNINLCLEKAIGLSVVSD